MKYLKVFFTVALSTFLATFLIINAQDTTMIATPEGNIGIGTSNPVEKLHVEGGLILNSAKGFYRIKHGGTNDGWFIGTFGGGKNLTFLTDPASGGGANQLNITQDGNVGIGTTEPTEALDVVGNINVSGLINGVDISSISSSDNRESKYFQFRTNSNQFDVTSEDIQLDFQANNFDKIYH